ncbi:uncharacterized protein LOC126673245 [Mercurialis annua]|uniref:uncharacterized protein LOC126673245 n=1 Tax=Mercurialis annua TaxID=3986 RepID=UPI00215E7663|nr:uncharacterized protein LOC126673245 [Mercurialis annua]
MAAPNNLAEQVTAKIDEVRTNAPNTEFKVITDAGYGQICVGPIVTSPSHLCDLTSPFHDAAPPRFSLPHQSSVWVGTTFRNWPIEHPGFSQWAVRLSPHFRQSWIDTGIHDLIELCKASRPIAKHYIMGASLFWSSAINCFCFKSGPMTVTLLDLALMLNVPLDGERINPNLRADAPQFNLTKAQKSYGAFVKLFMGEEPYKPDRNEHIAFLAFFIAKYILCTSSFRVTEDCFLLATALADGRRCNLGEFILAHLYRSLGDIAPLKDPRTFKCPGCPLWIVQLWLALYFPELFEVGPPIKAELCGFQLISAGTRLPHVLDVLQVFNNHAIRSPELMCPALQLTYPPSWLLAGWEVEDFEEAVQADPRLKLGGPYWGIALKCRNLVAGLDYDRSGVEPYCPNFVSRQFGFCQGLPCPLLIAFNNRGTHRTSIENYSKLQYIIRLNKAYLPPLSELSRPIITSSCTPEFTN